MKCVNLNNRPCQARPTLVKVFFLFTLILKIKLAKEEFYRGKKPIRIGTLMLIIYSSQN